MPLNAYISEVRNRVYEEIKANREPGVGDYSATALREARTKGQPSLGSTGIFPDRVELEFIFPDPRGAAAVFVVTVPIPERIVFMPVPDWVIENIWQGEVAGSYHFLSDAEAMLTAFRERLAPEPNLALFGRQDPTRRD